VLLAVSKLKIMEDRDSYLQRREEEKKYMTELSQSIRSFKEVRASVFGMSIRSTYSQIAYLSLHLNELNEARKFFFKGAKITAETFHIFKEARYPHLQKIGPLPFTSLFVKSFPDAVLCGSTSMLTEYATAIYEERVPPQGLLFNSNIMHAIKSLLLGDSVKGKQYAEDAHKPINFKGPYAGFSHAVKGILNNDLALLNEGLQLRLKCHSTDTKGTIFHHTCAEATALAKLAIDRGMRPDISSPFIHKSLLESTGDFKEGVSEILDALAIAERRNSGLLGKLVNIFRR
jgi:hypothetical protein